MNESNTSLLQELIDALKCQPSIGPKSAQRIAFYLLERDRQGGQRLAKALQAAMQHIGQCQRCRTLTEHKLCRICQKTTRNQRLLCVVETPSDVLAIEQATHYKGYYFVLHGRLSPLDGIGPEELGLEQLEALLATDNIQEIILATNPTIEGEVTAHYISEIATKHDIKTSRIAHGVPLGGELGYVDSGTLSHAFEGRTQY